MEDFHALEDQVSGPLLRISRCFVRNAIDKPN
jgi:hypothetical protein